MDEIEKIEENFSKESISFEEANNGLDNIDELKIVHKEITNAKGNIEKLNDSRVTYKKIVAYFENDEYKKVVDESDNIIEEDKNYNSAIEYKDKAIDKIEKEAIQNSEELAKKGEFKEAVKILNDSKKYVEEKNAINDLIHAYNEDISNGIIKEAKQESDDANYDMAINLLIDNKTYSYNGNIENEIQTMEELIKEENKDTILDIKDRLVVNYDDVDKEYKIGPKGYSTRYVNFSNTVNIEPRMTFKQVPTFVFGVGFHQRDWVFFEKVTFSIDDKTYDWDLGYFDRGSQVGNGISEWYLVVHSDLLSGYTGQVRDIEIM